MVPYLMDRPSKLCLKETFHSVSLDILQITNGSKKKQLWAFDINFMSFFIAACLRHWFIINSDILQQEI